MQTHEKIESAGVPVDIETTKLRKRSRWLGWLSGILALAVIALGTWLIFDGGEESASADLTPAQDQMLETIDAYLAAWNSGDGAAAVAVMTPSAYHDNGTKYTVANGELGRFIETVSAANFSVSRSDAAFVANYVMTTEHIPADNATERPSIYMMSGDGTKIMWHLAP